MQKQNNKKLIAILMLISLVTPGITYSSTECDYAIRNTMATVPLTLLMTGEPRLLVVAIPAAIVTGIAEARSKNADRRDAAMAQASIDILRRLHSSPTAQ